MILSFFRRLRHGLNALVHRSSEERALADEVRHYREQLTAEYLARGLSPAAARREADREFGREWDVVEQVRGYGWENRVESVAGDLRIAGRRLRSSPGFTAIVLLTLALGTGATTAIFGAVNAILLEPLPYPDPGRIVTIWDRTADDERLEMTFGSYREIAARSRTLAELAVLKPWQPGLAGGLEPERLIGQQVSAGYFRVLGVTPSRGREFTEAEDHEGGPAVVILSDALFRRRFGGDASILGSTIRLDDAPYTVIGVMPPGFENVPSPAAEVWSPLRYEMSQGRAWGHHLRAIGRVRSGATLDEAVLELNAIATTPAPEYSRADWARMEDGLLVSSLKSDVTRGVRPALLAILCAVAIVLAIACVNVTNLLLARSVRRRGELALRAVLGAQRGRLVRQMLTENLLLSAIAGTMGLGVAWIGVRLIRSLAVSLPRAGAIGVDARVFGFALAVTLAAGLASGLIPAWQAARTDVAGTLQQVSPRAAGRRGRIRDVLVMVEVALALMLLVGSGLLLRSLGQLFRVDSGFDAAGAISLQVQVSGPRFDADATRRFFEDALDAVRRVPGVESAGFTDQLPLSGDYESYGVHFEPARPDDPGQVQGGTFRYAVSPGYLETMRIPLLEGRLLDDRDIGTAPLVALISESLAKHRLPGVDPIGIRLRIGGSPTPYTVVGVVGDVKQMSLALNESEAVYTTAAQWPGGRVMSMVVRARGDPTELVAPLRAAIWSVDPGQPIARIATLQSLLAATTAERRFALLLFEAFALAALVLAAAGIYGVLSGAVAERTGEIGVRSALGASRASLLALVIRQGFALTGVGLAIGIVAAAALSRAMTSLLFGITRLDPLTYAAVTVLMSAVALLACALPAWRAARVDPASTLQSQ